MMRSVLDVAKTYRKNKYEGLDVAETKYVKGILTVCGESKEEPEAAE